MTAPAALLGRISLLVGEVIAACIDENRTDGLRQIGCDSIADAVERRCSERYGDPTLGNLATLKRKQPEEG